MPNKQYQRGSAFERRVKKQLEGLGWFAVKSAGSKGKVDVMAVRSGCKPLMIQCKLTGKITKAEAKELDELACSFDCFAFIAQNARGKTMLRNVINDEDRELHEMITRVYEESYIAEDDDGWCEEDV